MISSMTAFGRTEESGPEGTSVWEIRTVNHRYLEISLRLPEELRMLEARFREVISARISRGKVDATLRYEPPYSETNALPVNSDLVRSLLDAAHAIAAITPHTAPLNTMDILRWPGVICRTTLDPEIIGGPLAQHLNKALELVIQARRNEGGKLRAILLDRCSAALEIVMNIKTRIPEIITGLRDKLRAKAQDLKVELDPDRLEQEILLLAQKYDVAEEMDRLETHLNEVRRILDQKEPVGRRLDFLMQELNREANTLGSKAAHYDCTTASVNLKVLIEQMREQIQNIE
jgi:uncharacterized protein (TIGR00255 family)